MYSHKITVLSMCVYIFSSQYSVCLKIHWLRSGPGLYVSKLSTTCLPDGQYWGLMSSG